MKCLRVLRASASWLLFVCATHAAAQAPNENWRSIQTSHFYVHFTPNVEGVARRAAAEAERAYEKLATHLEPPRSSIDIIVTDHEDVSNGSASYFPWNRIVINARPPIDDAALRFGDDWIRQIITHELVHVFQLDRSAGLWRVAQFVFGRHSALFPHARTPRWLLEGLAIDYESRIGSGGRLNGNELYATASAVAAHDRSLLTPNRMSIAAPYWPGGNLAYFGGARVLAMAHEARGDSGMRSFFERLARYPLPYMWDWAARDAFGSSFTSLAKSEREPMRAPGATSATKLAGPYYDARAPRWRGDTVYYVASAPRELPGLFAATGDKVRRVARRNTLDAYGINGNRVVYAQLDFTDPYRLHSALYANGDKLRGAERLSAPDVRADGWIVAIDATDGGARLVIIRGDTARPDGIAGAKSLDVEWSAPRWSRSGDRIAAVRWVRGGQSAIVVLDAVGNTVATYGEARAVQSHPSWDVGDRAIYFTSDRGGVAATYRVRLAGADSGVVERVASAGFGLYDAEVSADGSEIAALRMDPEGLSVVRMPAPSLDARAEPAGDVAFAPAQLEPIRAEDVPSRSYSGLRTLLPRYWVPKFLAAGDEDARIGFYTSGSDVVGRQSYWAEVFWNVSTLEASGSGVWSLYGWGRPVLDIGGSIARDVSPVFDNTDTRVGDVLGRTRTVSLTTTWSRPRIRTNLFVSLGGELEWRDLRVQPDSLRPLIDPPLPPMRRTQSAILSAGWSHLSRSTLALSAEDGVSFSASARTRWRGDRHSNSVIGTARAYKSLPLAGHARHVIALRGSGAIVDNNAFTRFGVGGVSGASIEVIPGYSVGDSPLTFFVRGFPQGSLVGTRALGASAEYRAPLLRIGRGLSPLPIFFQRASVVFFGDAGSAWCPGGAPALVCPIGETPRDIIASAGGELILDTTLDYDSTTRFRLGVAAPVRGRLLVPGTNQATVYFTLGLPF